MVLNMMRGSFLLKLIIDSWRDCARERFVDLCFLVEVIDDGVVVDPTKMIDGVVPMMSIEMRWTCWDQPRELKIGLPLLTDERNKLIHLLRSYLDVFAWSYEDMLGLDSSIVQHHLPILPHVRSIKSFMLSFMDGFSRIMLFGLKNAGATYQRVATILFYDMMHKDVKLAFERIKEYFLSPPVLVPPIPRRPLLLHLVVSDMALGCMLAPLDDSEKDASLDHEEIEALHDRVLSASEFLPRSGSIVTDHLVSLLISESRPVDDNFLDKEFIAMTSLSSWCMYFDGVANHSGYRIGVLLVSLQGDHILRSAHLAFSDRHPSTNNIVEYEACILDLETALKLSIRKMEIYPSFFCGTDVDICPLLIELRYAPSNYYLIGEIEVATAKDGRALRSSFRKLCDEEVHVGVCGSHMGRHMLAHKTMRTSYFWITMETDYCQFVQRCLEFQIHGDLIHALPLEVHALTSPWPFSIWGIEIIWKISPKSSKGHEFILVAIKYFTKWVEAALYARGMASSITNHLHSGHRLMGHTVPPFAPLQELHLSLWCMIVASPLSLMWYALLGKSHELWTYKPTFLILDIITPSHDIILGHIPFSLMRFYLGRGMRMDDLPHHFDIRLSTSLGLPTINDIKTSLHDFIEIEMDHIRFHLRSIDGFSSRAFMG
ncbi:hypothetical protein CK203_046490 [Vitis vinifera]|uniref:Integrase zinc-binding domain-containing protein n=1 Tax=Vitis vinifera TaxID=29760 RepID=A0A438ILF7_VITVI|nr:hypothetical protein CK203_046490 [Vitis vinifera]